jgi:hypothetical protein
LSCPPSGGVAQLVRALPCHGRGYGFEPRRSRHSFLLPTESNRLHRAATQSARGQRHDLGFPASERLDWSAGAVPAACSAQVQQSSESAEQGTGLRRRVALRGQEVHARRLFAPGLAGARDAEHCAGSQPVGALALLPGFQPCGAQSTLFPPALWLGYGALAQPARRLRAGRGFDALAA